VPSDALRQRLQSDLTVAAKARDRVTVSVLRTTLTLLANAEAVDASGSQPEIGLYANEAARRTLSDEEARRLVGAERDELRALAAEMRALDQIAEADRLAAQVAVLDGYLGDHD
jgi:uncharacterized protein YqeY